MSGKGKGGKAKVGKAKGGKAKGGKGKAKSDDGTISWNQASTPATRLLYAKNLTDTAESRQCAKKLGLTKAKWIAHEWQKEGRSNRYAVRDPNGKCYEGIKEARDAHNGLVKKVFLCLQEDDDGNVCGLPKEACISSLGANIYCSCNKGSKHMTPSLDNIAAGVTKNDFWKLATEEDGVDDTKVAVSALFVMIAL